jgi:hypothetical protein
MYVFDHHVLVVWICYLGQFRWLKHGPNRVTKEHITGSLINQRGKPDVDAML